MSTVALTLPYPPSVNHAYVGGQRRFASTQLVQYKAAAGWAIVEHLGRMEPLVLDVIVTVHFYRPSKTGDLDNRLKALLDVLTGMVYEDDKQVVEIHAYRHDDAKNPRVEVQITEVTR